MLQSYVHIMLPQNPEDHILDMGADQNVADLGIETIFTKRTHIMRLAKPGASDPTIEASDNIGHGKTRLKFLANGPNKANHPVHIWRITWKMPADSFAE